MKSVGFLDYQHSYIDEKNDSGAFTGEVKQWSSVIALPIVGLLILFTFLSLGGIFAILGPCAIFIVARIITRHWDKKARKIATVESAKDKCYNMHALTEFYPGKNIQ